MSAHAISLTDTERDFMRILNRNGFFLLGARRRFRGFTLILASGTIGDLEEHRIPRAELPREAMRIVAAKRRRSSVPCVVNG